MSERPQSAPVWILLATFNGARFLPELMASLFAQTDSDWIVLASDDASEDRTPELLRDYAARDRRIVLLPPVAGRLGACANFERLLQAALEVGAGWFALCDQDDVWYVEKLAAMRAALLNPLFDAAVPMLAYADLALIDDEGRCLAPSHFGHAGVPQVRTGVDVWLLAHNLVPGCAMLGNRALLELALPLPAQVRHHDWWLLLVAAAAGEVRAVDAVLTGYRQHSGNLIGAASPMRRAWAFVSHFAERFDAARRQYALAVAQDRALLERSAQRVGPTLNPRWARLAACACAQLGSARCRTRVAAVLGGPVRRLGMARNLLMLVAAACPMPDRNEGPQC